MNVCHSPESQLSDEEWEKLCREARPIEDVVNNVCQSPEIICPYCGCEKIIVARDGFSTRKCTKCFNTWLHHNVCATNETLSLCKHGNPVKFGCSECHYLKQETITIKKSLWDEMLDYKKQVNGLISNQQAAWQDIKELENKIKSLTGLFKQYYERIEKLESKQKFLEENWKKIQRLDKQDDEMSDRIENLEERINYISRFLNI